MNKHAILLFFLAVPLWSHDAITTKLTWTQEISRIVYKRCGSCHREGGAAMSLLTYEAVRPWAKAIRDEVLSRRMPPWGAVQGVGNFAGDPSLSQPEIDMLVGWVEGGAPQGDPAFLPTHLPVATPVAAMPKYSRTVVCANDTKLVGALNLVAIRPKGLQDGASLEAWAIKPDGAVERLLWVNRYRRRWAHDYVLANPLLLPAGTRLRVAAKPGAVASFLGK
jgi:hypothetical protein